MSQQVPSEERLAIVIELVPFPSVTVTLIFEAFAVGPSTNDVEGLLADRLERSTAPYPPTVAAAVEAAVIPDVSACWAWRSFASATPGAFEALVSDPLSECKVVPKRIATNTVAPNKLSTIATIEKPELVGSW